MAKLVDALVSGTSVSDDVQVRVLFWALKKIKDKRYKIQDTRKKEDYFYHLWSWVFILGSLKYCPDGEIGRHASLRGWCRLRCASSSLVLGTIKSQVEILILAFSINQPG